MIIISENVFDFCKPRMFELIYNVKLRLSNSLILQKFHVIDLIISCKFKS